MKPHENSHTLLVLKRCGNVASNSSLLAISLTILAVSILAGMDSLGKMLMQTFSPLQATWARFFFHALIVALIFFVQGQRDFYVTHTPKIQLLRGLCMVGVNTSLYIAIQTVSLAEATALMYLSPVIVTLLAGLLLGERIQLSHIMAVSLGFLGVWVILRPGFQVIDASMLWVLIAAFLLALYFLLTRKVAGVDDARTSLFYSSIVGAVLLSLLMPWWWVQPNAWQWLLLVAMGGLGAAGHFLLIKAYSLIPAAELSPWLYAQVIAATVFSVLFFQDELDGYFLLGTGLIIGSGIVLGMRQRAAKQ